MTTVVSDLLGASGRRVLAALAAGEHDAGRLAEAFDHRVRATQQQRLDAVDGDLPPAHRIVLKQHLERIALLEQQQGELQRLLSEQLKPYQDQVRRLVQVPGINVIAAQHLLAEIGARAASRTKGSYWERLFRGWVRRMPPTKALWAVAHRLLRLIWKLLAQGVDYQELGPRLTDHRRLALRMKRLKHDFRPLGYEVTFVPAQPLSRA